jgi:shikimate kinase
VLAARLGWRVVDSDARIVERERMSIPEIFARHGELRFRELEREIAPQLALLPKVIISTGGGMLTQPETLATFESHGMVVCLNATPETIHARVGHDANRPLLKGDWRELLESRRAAYAAIPFQIDTTGKSIEQVVDEVMVLWQSKST